MDADRAAGLEESGEPEEEPTMARTPEQNDPQPRLEELMVRDPLTVTPETTLREVVELLGARHISGMPVVTGETVVGVISVSDILSFLASAPVVPTERPDQMEWGTWGAAPEWTEGKESPSSHFLEFWHDTGAEVFQRFKEITRPEGDLLSEHTVGEVMTPVVCSLPPDATAAEAAAYMLRFGVHRVLVMEDDKLCGLVTTIDLMRALAEPQR
jgi:CBS domain-containing protein